MVIYLRVMPKEMQSALICAKSLLFSCILIVASGVYQVTYAQDWLIHRGNPALTGYLEQQVSLPSQLKWSFKVAKGQISSPVAKDGCVYVSSVKGDVYKIKAENAEVLWHKQFERGSFAAAATLVDDLLVLASERGRLLALRQSDGSKLWEFKSTGKFIGSANSYRRKDGQLCILAVSWDNHLYALRADTGEQLWSYATENKLNATPAVVDANIIFGGCDGFVRVLDAESGTELAAVDAGSYIAASLAVEWPKVFVGHHEGKLLCIEPFNEKIVWSYHKREEPFVSSPALTPNSVILGSDDQRVHAVDRDGSFLWEFASNGKVMSSPLVLSDKVFIGSDDGFFYGLDRKTGAARWSYEIGAEIDSDPAYIDGLIMVSARDGTVYAFSVEPQ